MDGFSGSLSSFGPLKKRCSKEWDWAFCSRVKFYLTNFIGAFASFATMRGRLFTYLAASALFTLMLFKVTSFHIYTHQDSSDKIENCETCYFSFQNQKIDFRVASVLVLAIVVLVPVSKKILVETNSLQASPSIHCTLFGRPPPIVR